MPRRFEIELTSRTDDGSFTWRVAGAKQPRGLVGAGLLPPGAGVGDVVRAELESGLEGLEVVTVQPLSAKEETPPADRIEVLGVSRRAPDISVTYAPGSRRRHEDGEGPRAERGGRREARRPGGGPTERGRRSRARPGDAGGDGPRDDSALGTASGHGDAGDEGGRASRRPAGAGSRPGREPRERRDGSRADQRDGRGSRPEGAGLERAGGLRRDRDRRAPVSTTHRNALLATLGPQELPIAEQLMRGGLPAVRQAIAEHGAGRPGAGPDNREAVLAVAEQLVPRVSLASWKDRASAAQAAGRDLRLRELRAVVTSSRTVSLDDEARSMAKALHESLDQRIRALREDWLSRMTKALDEGRVAEAMSLSARPPELSLRLPAELAVRLAELTGAAMTAASDPATWQALLDAVLESPVRRTVKPQGIPDDPEARDSALRAAGSVPELAKLLGLRIPPPPPRRPGGTRRVIAVGGGEREAGR